MAKTVKAVKKKRKVVKCSFRKIPLNMFPSSAELTWLSKLDDNEVFDFSIRRPEVSGFEHRYWVVELHMIDGFRIATRHRELKKALSAALAALSAE